MHDLVSVPSVASESAYRTKIESHINITKTTVGASNSSGEYWIVKTPDGTKYRFGQATNSELMCNTRSYTYTWNLDLVEDTHGNKIFYTYSEDNNNGASYLSKIEYNTEKARVIDFTYNSNPNPTTIYVQGCKVKELSRLSNIEINANSSRVRGFDLSYVTATNSGQLLKSITETGTSSGSALPATVFDYQPEVQSWQSSYTSWSINNAMDAYLHMTNAAVRLLDVNGDGYADILKVSSNGGTNTYGVYKNTGSTFSNQLDTWLSANIDANPTQYWTRLTDVNGDGLPDIVKATQDTWYVWKNTGSSWNSQYEIWASGSNLPGFTSTNNNVALADVTGDGLPDVVKTTAVSGPNTTIQVWRNTGTKFNPSAETWVNNQTMDTRFDQPNVTLADVNGDGLADFVKPVNQGGPNNDWRVWLNTGSSWDTTYVTWANPIDANLDSPNVLLTEASGDSFPEIVKVQNNGGPSNDWQVWQNKRNSWTSSSTSWVNPIDSNLDNDEVAMADINGDGLIDIIRSVHTGPFDNDWRLWKNNGYAPNLLSKIHTAQGGTISFEYKPSTQYDNTGADANPDLRFPMWVVSKMTVNNGMVGLQSTSDVTTYSYQDGLFDWEDKEFRGFAVVDTVEPNGAKKKYVFNQSDDLKGLLAEAQTRDGSNNPYSEIENTWTSFSRDGVYTVNLAEEKEFTFDGTASDPKVKATEYSYDSYGNLTKKTELGDPVASGDERFTYNDYIYNPSMWIVNTLAHTVLKSSNDSTKVSEKWLFYDSDPSTVASASAPQASKFGDGSDGNIIISSSTTETPTDSGVTANSGSNVASVSATAGFFANQLVLFHQTQGTNAGTWEIARVESHTGTTLKLTSNLTNSYSSSGSNRAQVRVLPQYHDVTVNSGTIWSAKAWNETTGGILAFLADGTVTVNGSISATGKGFRGGDGGTYTTGPSGYNNVSNRPGFRGEGTNGDNATKQTSANGNGGGGGGTGGATMTDAGGGGGGGGYASSGSNGTNDNQSPTGVGGTGGGSVGSSAVSSLFFGGGGGGGGLDDTFQSHAGNGGAGGGIVFIGSSSLDTSSGTIAVNGSNGTSSGDSGGGGGGGAGGTVKLLAQTATIGTNKLTVAAGSGASGNSAFGGVGGNGGNGSAGRIGIVYETSLNGSTTPSSNSAQDTIATVPAGIISWSSNSSSLTKGDLTKEVNWLDGGTNPETKYEYDSYGNVTKVIDQKNHETIYTYNINDATRTYPEMVTNAKGQQSNITYDLGTGNILTKTDPNSLTTSYVYDLFGRVTKEIKPYDNSTYPTMHYAYDLDGIAPETTKVSVRTNLASGSADTIDTYTSFDGLTRKIQTRSDAEDTSKQIVIDTYYDPTGGILKETVPYLATASASFAAPLSNARGTTMTYDPIGRVTMITNPKGDNKTVAYDHWKETEIDENGHIKRRYLNAYGKIAKVDEVINNTTHATNYVYNTLDQLTQIIDSASNSGTFTYDTLGRKTSQTDPDMGTWAYAYDAAGNLLGSTDGRNVTIGRTYDELNRLISVDYPNDTDLSFAYDLGKIGTLSVASDSAGMVSYTYDNRLRKTAETRVIGGTSKTTTFAYDSADRMINQTNPDGTQSNYTFNDQGEIETLDGILDNVDYNALGKITSKTFDNGLTTNYTYNTDDFRLNRIQTAALQDLNYTYDPVGNISSIVDEVTDRTKLFSYDDLDRLTTASESGGFNFAYEYNPIGNLTKFTTAGSEIEYAYGEGSAGPHAMTSSSASASASTQTITFDDREGEDDVLNGEYPTDIIDWGTDIWWHSQPWNLFTTNSLTFNGSGTTSGTFTFISPRNLVSLQAYNGGGSSTTVTLSCAGNTDKVEVIDSDTIETIATGWANACTEVTIASTNGWDTNYDNLVIGAGSGAGDTVNIALDKPATASAMQDNDPYFVPSKAVDGNTGTRWGSGYTDTEWIQVDLGATYDISRVKLNWETAYAEGYMIQVSSNSANWSTIYTTTTGDGGIDDLTGLSGSGRYVRMQSTERGGYSGVSLWEFEVYGHVSEGSTLTNISSNGTGYRWSQNTSQNSDSNKATASGINDGNESVDVHLNNGSDDNEDAWEAAGIVWSASQSAITTVEYINGIWDGNNNGAFTQNFTLQFTYDGTTWIDSGWEETPAYDHDNSAASGKKYTFTGSPVTAKGARVVGQVRTSGANSWHAFARELKVFTEEESEPSGETITYDANGNMTSDGENKCYEYNDANQLKKVKDCSNNQTIAEYVYDYNGLRMVKKNYTSGSLANTVISWSDSFETRDIVGGSIETTNYFFANNELVAKKKPDGSKMYFHNDHLGSNSLTTDQSGLQVEVTSYDPWGKVLGGATQSKFQYTGQEKDDETGLNYYNARYYSSDLKRFTQPDPLIQNVYDPQTLNRYSYVRNNPLKYTDPTGNCFGDKGLFNRICGAVKSAFSKADSTPKPASTAKLPNDKVLQQPIVKGSNSSSGGGAPPPSRHSQPPSTKGAQDLYNFFIGDDIKTLQNPNASVAQKTIAGVGIVGNVIPAGKVAKLAKFVSPAKATEHFMNHGARLGFKTEAEYVAGANRLFEGGNGVEAILREGDSAGLFYREATNEFGIIGKNGIIRSYYAPDDGLIEWENQIMKHAK